MTNWNEHKHLCVQQCVFLFHQLMSFLPEEEKRTITFHLGLGCSSVKIGTAMVVVSVCVKYVQISLVLYYVLRRLKYYKDDEFTALARVSLGFWDMLVRSSRCFGKSWLEGREERDSMYVGYTNVLSRSFIRALVWKLWGNLL